MTNPALMPVKTSPGIGSRLLRNFAYPPIVSGLGVAAFAMLSDHGNAET